MNDLVGKTVGQYQLIEFIARGETAVVYKGFQPTMNRYVTIKLLSPSLARNSEVANQFQREAELMSQLEHENILPVFDYGQQAGAYYMATRHIEGSTLRRRLADYQSPQAAYQLLRPLTDALDYLHERGITHGNLRPSNIIIDLEDRPLLGGLGFVQRARGVVPESNVYLSPEQAQGGAIDGRTDVYALGVILFEMMVGEPPPVGAVPSPRIKRPNLPEQVEMVILKAMAQFPDQRFQSCGEFSGALEAALLPVRPVERETQVVQEPPPGPVIYSAPEQPKQARSWMYIVIAGLIGLLIICAIASFFIFFKDARDEVIGTPLPEPTVPEATPPPAEPGVPTVMANTDLNVRSGPGTQYDVLGVMRLGQTAQAVGLSPDLQWYAIAFPTAPNGNGWVQANLVTVENTENLPILAPPPTPTILAPTAEATPPELPTLTPTDGLTAVQPLPTSTPDSGGGLCGTAALGLAAVLVGTYRPMKRRFRRRKNDQIGL